MTDETNPETPEVEIEEEVIEEAYEGEEPELDEDGNPIEEPEELFEVEANGKKYQLPKELRDQFLMQQDYTRKTQEVAEQRKALEAERQQAQQMSEGEFKARAQIVQIDEALTEFRQIDWDTWMSRDQPAAQRAWMQYQRLQDERGNALTQYQQIQQERTLQEQRETAERLQKGLSELQAKIPDWSPNKAAALLDFGEKQLGFSRQELNAIDDPRMIIALNLAAQALDKQAASRTAAKAQVQSSVKPAARVSGGRTPSNRVDDRVSTDAWMKARQAQVSKR